MKLFELLLALTLNLILMFFLIRGQIRLYVNANYKKATVKKLYKNQTFFEWFFYTRFKDMLPKSKRIWYFSHLLLYPILVIAVVMLYVFDAPYNIGRILLGCYFYGSAIPLIMTRGWFEKY